MPVADDGARVRRSLEAIDGLERVAVRSERPVEDLIREDRDV